MRTRSVAVVVIRPVLGVCVLVFSVPGTVLLLGTVTWRGRGLGLWALLTAWLCASLMGAVIGKRPRQWRGLAAVSLVVAVVLAAATPDGRTEGGRIRNCFIAPDSFRRWHPLNWIAEADWAGLGLRVMPWVDEYARREPWQEVQRLANELFAKSAYDPDTRRLGCNLHYALDDIIGRQSSGIHYYAVFPQPSPSDPRARYPVIVFLHGWLGNMSVYPLLMRHLADRTGAVVLIPSGRVGFWIYPDAPVMVSRVLEDACRRFPLDTACLAIGGISNGGRGAWQTAAVLPEKFGGLFLISALMEPMFYGPDTCGASHPTVLPDGRPLPIVGSIEDSGLAKVWGKKPVLVLSGDHDVRLPETYTNGRVALMRNAGLNVEHSVYAGEDHWMLFRSPDRLIDEIARWIERGTLE